MDKNSRKLLFLLIFALAVRPLGAAHLQTLILKAQKIDASHLILSWEDPNPIIVQGYNVYSRQGGQGPFFKLNSKLLRTNQYYLTATADSQFTFQVREVVQQEPLREGLASLELMFSQRMNSVDKKALDPSPRGIIDLVKVAHMAKWAKPGRKNLAGYNAYYCEKQDGAFIKANDEPFSKVKALLKNLTPGKNYYLVFTSLGSNNKESEPSGVLMAQAELAPPDQASLP